MRHLLSLSLLLVACAGEADSTPATCTQVGSTYTYGQGSKLVYECDKDPGEDCQESTQQGRFECPAALTQANVVCP